MIYKLMHRLMNVEGGAEGGAPAGAPAPVQPAQDAAPVKLDISAPEDISDEVGSADEVQAESDGPITYQPTGYAGVDLALGFIGKLGISATDPAVQAAQTGNFAFLKARLASMGDKATGWEQFVALAEHDYKVHVETTNKKQAEITSEVHKVVGGEQAWADIQAWARATATPEERADFNKMLNGSLNEARAAAQLLRTLYHEHPDRQQTPRNPVSGNQSAGNQSSNSALDPVTYRRAVAELSAKIGAHRMATSPEYANLQARRRAFRG